MWLLCAYVGQDPIYCGYVNLLQHLKVNHVLYCSRKTPSSDITYMIIPETVNVKKVNACDVC